MDQNTTGITLHNFIDIWTVGSQTYATDSNWRNTLRLWNRNSKTMEL